MSIFVFSEANDGEDQSSTYEMFLEIFLELSNLFSGDVLSTLEYLRSIDEEYKLSTKDYNIDNFIEDLKKKDFIAATEGQTPTLGKKASRSIQKRIYKQLFSDLKRSNKGNHTLKKSGSSTEYSEGLKKFQYGDAIDRIDYRESIRSAYQRSFGSDWNLSMDDLKVQDTLATTTTSTVLMIDISHSMILYGEDRITPAKKVAMGLSEYIRRQFPQDQLSVLVFGNEAWEIGLDDIPLISVGPFHTNTIAGLELASEILKKSKSPNKQIFMITDGKPSCMRIGKKLYKNSFGLDDKIIKRTLAWGEKCQRMRIKISTFMVADNPLLMEFIKRFTKISRGKAIFCELDQLGEDIIFSYWNHKNRRNN